MNENAEEDHSDRRGYYSETITKKSSDDEEDNEDEESKSGLAGAFRRTKLLWQVRTERHAPIIQQLPPTTKPCFLAPAERWMSYADEKCIVSTAKYSLSLLCLLGGFLVQYYNKYSKSSLK